MTSSDQFPVPVKEHITKYSIKSTINSTEAANLPGPSSAPLARKF